MKLLQNIKRKLLFSEKLKESNMHKEYKENFLTILGYSYRLEDIKQRLFLLFLRLFML